MGYAHMGAGGASMWNSNLYVCRRVDSPATGRALAYGRVGGVTAAGRVVYEGAVYSVFFGHICPNFRIHTCTNDGQRYKPEAKHNQMIYKNQNHISQIGG